jgi:hypothetical protein
MTTAAGTTTAAVEEMTRAADLQIVVVVTTAPIACAGVATAMGAKTVEIVLQMLIHVVATALVTQIATTTPIAVVASTKNERAIAQ